MIVMIKYHMKVAKQYCNLKQITIICFKDVQWFETKLIYLKGLMSLRSSYILQHNIIMSKNQKR